jgi:hypothetical protein
VYSSAIIRIKLFFIVCACRGEVAFCSQECRQQQMNLDELMEKKCSTPAGGGGGGVGGGGGGGSDQPGKSSTVAAA